MKLETIDHLIALGDPAAVESFLDGRADGAHHLLPRRNDESYLNGYLSAVRELPAVNGVIQHPCYGGLINA